MYNKISIVKFMLLSYEWNEKYKKKRKKKRKMFKEMKYKCEKKRYENNNKKEAV